MSSIAETASLLDLNDLSYIDAISQRILRLQALHNDSLTSLQLSIDSLTRQNENIAASIKSITSSQQTKQTRHDLKKLENQIFNTARSITSLNMQINSLKLSYNDNLKRLSSLHSTISLFQTPQNSNTPNNLIYKLYNATGVRIVNDEVVILNKQSNKISTLSLDDSYSDYFVSNFIWDAI
ncbi:hypothetical protein DAPK24_031400 [Pichia kluyveri]|uniref:Kinetochore protein Spc24 n=1 Tax=Pichia kluyveri TaxID=36015 RepID=A0AAV5R5K8_PICKL|nr:hypothetical protein DAPK24_031400 [Pichia kluyveri]